jgi:hypothetical protein
MYKKMKHPQNLKVERLANPGDRWFESNLTYKLFYKTYFVSLAGKTSVSKTEISGSDPERSAFLIFYK